MAEFGDEKLFAAAREIARTLGKDEAAAGDILQILSGFDGRFPLERAPRKAGDHGRPSVRATIDRSLNSLETQISGYMVADRPIWSSPADSSAFLDAIDELLASVGDWRPMAGDKSVAVCLSRADELIQQAMFRLQEEFKFLMDEAGDSFGTQEDDDLFEGEDRAENYEFESDQMIVARPVSDYTIVIEALPPSTVNDLQGIAKRMVAGGFEKECSRAYSGQRREFLEESLSRLRLRKLSIEEVQEAPWQDLEDEIDHWIKAIAFAFHVLFPSECLLCHRVFSGSPSAVADLSFMEVCRGSTTQLLNFADGIAIGSRSPERLFKVMDVYEAIGDLMPTIESLFSDQYCSIMRNEAAAIQKRLGEAIRRIFMELENLIRRDPAKTPFPGGGIHPITRYVMNYLRAACKSHPILEQVLEGSNKGTLSRGTRTLSVQISWVLELLESNLEAKSKIYTDLSLCFVFIMNNGKYILEKVKDSELGLILGEDWIAKHDAKLRQYRSNYRRSSWNPVVGLLKAESSLNSMKESLRLFNSRFNEICKTQSAWIVPDEQLRDELRISVTRLVLPAYGNFIGRFKDMPAIGRRADKHISYSVEDLEARVKKLFQGNTS